MTSGALPEPELPDRELAAGFVAGDQTSLEESYRRWAPLVYSTARRSLPTVTDAEDVTQQTFVAAWRSRADFDAERGSLAGWLLGIARHRIADRRRAVGRERRLVGAAENEALREQFDADDLGRAVDRVVLSAEIQQLPHPRGTILRLAFWEGRSYPQIAEQLDLPLGTVKSHARRALLHLRRKLTEVTSWST